MPWWPGWNSIDGTEFWSAFHFWAGIACLLLLGVFEVLSHYYGERHSALVEIAASEAAQMRDEHDRQTEKRHAAEIAGARAAAEQLQKLNKPRALSPEQRQVLVAAIKPYAGTPFVIAAQQLAEPLILEEQIESALTVAGWIQKPWDGGGDIVISRPNAPSIGLVTIVGVYIQLDNAAPAAFSPAVLTLGNLLIALGIPTEMQRGNFPIGNKEVIRVLVGARNP
jgi:hypothetical protein